MRKSNLMMGAATACLLAVLPQSAGAEEETFVITGTPLGGTQADTAMAVTVIDSEEIQEAGAMTLGELLAELPGISQSSFSAGASRPIIRGLDNHRVRIQENGIGSHDASALSEDHGVSIDPLSARRIEVVRGPAVLRYGTEAIGGVVNVINDRIPTRMPDGGASGELFGMHSTGDDGFQVGGVVDVGFNNFVVHADAFWRDSGDYDIPGTPGEQFNTWVEQSGAAFGAGYVGSNSHFGASVSIFESEYGIPPGEHEIFIDMEQTRFQVGGGFAALDGPFTEVRGSVGMTDYTHDEIELDTGDVGSTFNNEEVEGRVELLHAPIGPFVGAFGVQVRDRDLSASGEGGELIAPSDTWAIGAFLFEQVAIGPRTTFEFAARADSVEVNGTGFLPILPNGMEFAATRDFTPLSASAGLVFDVGGGAALSGTAQVVQRAPDALELFSKGPHEATETFEIGDPDLSVETARSLEVTFERDNGPFRFEVAGFFTDFNDFIFKALTGVECGEEFDTCGVEDELSQIVYSQQGAQFSGFEASAEWDALPIHNGFIVLSGQADHVRAELDDGSRVPRIPPFRYGAGIAYESDALTIGTSFLHVAEQDSLAAFETMTDAYTRVDAEAIYRFDMPNTDTPFELGLVGTNLLDEEARNHSSFKKDDVLLPGRSLRAFLRARF